MWTRRGLLRTLGGAAFGAPLLARVLEREAAAAGQARRVIFFYFPDGIAGASQSGEPSLWRPAGSERGFVLSPLLEPLERHRGECLFFSGLSLGPTDSGSHPGGAKKLLTAVDGGGGESIDQRLARTAGATAPFRHLYLGAMATHDNASGDKFISYAGPGQPLAPEDDPARAFARLFGPGAPAQGGAPAATPSSGDRRRTVIDAVRGDLEALQSRLGAVEQRKLAQHLAALREVEARIQAASAAGTTGGSSSACVAAPPPALTADALAASDRFPEVLRLQMDLMVQAMACGLTQVGVLQASHHTSELIMSRFAGSEMYDPGFDMRSHQASHYGARHDPAHREFRAYLAQRRWWVAQFAYLLDQLRARPEGDGTMLDYSLVLLASEVSDGNTHLHDDMPFVLAGRAGGAVEPGRMLSFPYARHANLLLAIAHAMGQPLARFGDASSGPLPGVLR